MSFELSSLCNYSHLHKKCPIFYCKEHEIMSAKVYFKVLDELVRLKYTESIYLSVYNEPLIDPRLFIFTKTAKEKLPKCRVGFTTNGWYLDQNIADELKDYGVDAMNISIYTEEEDARISKIKFNIPVCLRNYIGTANMDNRLQYYADSDGTSSKCSISAPLHNITINHKGNVVLCCIEWQYRCIFGNVLRESLIDIINKPKFLAVSRLTQCGEQDFTWCKHCNGQYYVILPHEMHKVRPDHRGER